MNGNPCARAGGAFAYVMGRFRDVERKRLDLMQAEMDRIARGVQPRIDRTPVNWWRSAVPV